MAYNAEVGVRSEVRPEDVFSVHHLEPGSEGEAALWFSPNPEGLDGSALDDDQFRRDFEELHTYFSQTKLEQLHAIGRPPRSRRSELAGLHDSLGQCR